MILCYLSDSQIEWTDESISGHSTVVRYRFIYPKVCRQRGVI